MDTRPGTMSAYFHPRGEPEVREWAGHDTARDRSGRLDPAPSPTAVMPFWTAAQNASATTHQTMEAESISMYPRPPPMAYAGGGSSHHVGMGFQEPSPSILPAQPSQRMRSMSVHVHHGAAFSTRTGQAPQACQLSDTAAAAYQRDRAPTEWNPSPVRSALQNNPQSLASAHVAETPALRFSPPASNQSWEEMVATAFAQRAHAPVQQVHPWEPSEAPSFANDASSVEPMHAQNADEDHDAHTFLCEWTDEHGMCNMDILGDRVWMNHHLSRHHNVVGHERSQRACLWRGCTDVMNKGSLARHVVSRHLRAGTSCGFCSKVYSRADVARRHTKKCKAANGAMGQQDQIK